MQYNKEEYTTQSKTMLVQLSHKLQGKLDHTTLGEYTNQRLCSVRLPIKSPNRNWILLIGLLLLCVVEGVRATPTVVDLRCAYRFLPALQYAAGERENECRRSKVS